MADSSSNSRINRLRARRKAAGLRPVVLWLPDTRSAAYRARIARQCRDLARLSPDTQALAMAIEREAAHIPGWE